MMLKAEQIIKRLKCLGGFTIAEILIAMVVLGLLGALTVPMLGQQKGKPWLKTRRVHGTVECYYDETGTLRMFVSDNQEDKNGHEISAGESDDNGNSNDGEACYFTMPNANTVTIQAVGAGGDGGHWGEDAIKPGYDNATEDVTGSIRVDNNFTDDMEAAPGWVREEWDRQWDNNRDTSGGTGRTVDQVEYKLTSALGGGGMDVCRKKIQYYELDENPDMYEKCSGCAIGNAAGSEFCPNECIVEIGADGGNGAKGRIVHVKTVLRYSPSGQKDYVTFDYNSRPTVDNGNPASGVVKLEFAPDKYVKLQSSSRGKDAEELPIGPPPARGRDKYPTEFDGTPWVDNAYYRYAGNTYHSKRNLISSGNVTIVRRIDGETYNPGRTKCDKNDVVAGKYTPGSIEVVSPVNKKISYKTGSLAIKGYFGLAGEPGITTRVSFEHIPIGSEFKLIPAQNSSKPSEVKMKKDDDYELMFKADSGKNGDYFATGEKIPVADETDFPFPKKFFPEKLKGRLSELSISSGNGYKSQLAGLLTNKDFMPGASGFGTYPLVERVSGNATHVINNVITGNEILDGLRTAPGFYDDYECLDGSEPRSGGYNSSKYCGEFENELSNPMKGKPGVVVISW